MNVAEDRYLFNEYRKYKTQLDELEGVGDGQSRSAGKIRQSLCQLWNGMTPEMQREVATIYLGE